MTAQVIGHDLAVGGRVAEPRQIDHLAGLRSTKAAAAAASTREVVAILDRHDGDSDGWGGFVRTGDPVGRARGTGESAVLVGDTRRLAGRDDRNRAPGGREQP